MVELHKKIGTWQTKVDRYIALTEFSKNKYIEAGWPAHKIAVKPNFIQDPFDGDTFVAKEGGYSLFVGRLSEEKGVDILFESWANITGKLKVIGDGPLKVFVESKSSGEIEFLGRKDKSDVLDLVRNADFIVMPSTWYEGFPMVLVEAFACGTPALVSRLGSMEEIVEDGVTGLHFEAGNSQDLAEKAQWLIDNPERMREMGQNARNEYLAKYTPEKNYAMLMDIYKQAIDEAKKTQ
jgi:glycosyltransferase involved in cell wall biosynthesis